MPSIPVHRPAPHELLDALRILVGGADLSDREVRARRCRDAFLGGEYRLDGLFIARNRHGRPGAAALVQVMPGALGVAWAPRGVSDALTAAATRAACDWLQSREVRVCQAFSVQNDREAMRPLERCGFRRITQLVFLRRLIAPAAVQDGRTPGPVECLPQPSGSPAGRERLLLETHEGTLDCPELNSPRSPAEILAGFVPGTAARCNWWHTLVDATGEVGVLLLDSGTDPTTVQLSYLGVIPRARRRGVARAALAAADRIAARCGYQALCLSVDARNEPALALYQRDGFEETQRQDVYLWDVGVRR
jgi:ribosomal protein S18 acetylase RimI-like enzyme